MTAPSSAPVASEPQTSRHVMISIGPTLLKQFAAK